MRHSTTMFFNILLLLLQTIVVSANVFVGFPFSQQLPDIARIGESYTFTINSQTFKSDNNDNDDSVVNYQAFNLPQWLSFDAASLTFSGLPTESDSLGNVDFILQGTNGESLNQSCTIYLSDQPSPQLNPNDSMQTQLENLGSTNGYSGIVLDPQQPFSFSFSKDTFQVPSSSNNEIVTYYGKSANRTSLPSWCFFDESTLTFSGTTPPVNAKDAPSLQFDLTLIATDYQGFSASYSDFRIVVGGHNLYIINSTDFDNMIMTNPGDDLSIDLPINDIYLDNNQIQPDQIESVIIHNSPSWISIQDNSKLVGTVPQDQTENLVINVTLSDIYLDSVYMDFEINVIHDIFDISSIPNITATPGSFFEYSLPDSYFKNKTATDITSTFDDNWLTFYHSNNTFVGLVPNDFKSTQITLQATMNSLSQKMSFFLVSNETLSSSSSFFSSSSIMPSSSSSSIARSSSIASSRVSSTSVSTSSTSSTAIEATSSSATLVFEDPNEKSTDSKKKLAIGLGVGIPVLLIIIAAILLIFCCCGKRRKDNKDDDDENGIDSEYMQKNKTNDTLVPTTAAAIAAQKNLKNLEKDNNDQSSYYSNTQSTLTDKGNSSLYQDANNQMSTDHLLVANKPNSNNSSGIFNSWRKSATNGFKTRDSLSSLATVATSDLLTVNVVNDDKIRKSQMILPTSSKLKINSNSTDSFIGNSTTQFNNNLEPLRETEIMSNATISRDTSYETMSSDAQLVGFNNSGSLYRSEQPEQQSYRGELSSISGDENDFHSQSSNNGNNYPHRL